MLLHALGWNDRWSAHFAPYADAGLVPGRVVRVDRDRVVVAVDDGADVVARARDLPGVGDWVALDGEAVAAVLPRVSALVRRDPGRPVAQVIAANVDVVFVVAVDPEANLRRIERTLAMVWESGAVPAVVLTKPDRCPDLDDQVSAVRSVALGVDVYVVNGLTGDGVDDLRGDRTAVFVGQSGAGKSTVTNWLLGSGADPPALALATAEVREGDRKGRHTTTARHLVVVPGGGVVIDTPGMRALATWDVREGATAVFVDIDELADGCRFRDCRHDAEPGCAVVGVIDADRLRNWRHLAQPVDPGEAKRRARIMEKGQRQKAQIGTRGGPPRR